VHLCGTDGEVSIVAPSVVDPSCAPEGFSNIELLALVPHDEAAGWFEEAGTDLDALRANPAYIARKQAVADRLIERACAAIPDLRARIVMRVDASPVTYHRYSLSTAGAIYGVQPRAGRLPLRTPLRNLVLAGAATHGGGVEAVVISGALAAEVLRPGLLDQAVEDEAVAA
jgi:phytoene dehydrogenase-like protein